MIINLNQTNDDSNQVEIIANTIYSYECVRGVAQAVVDRDASWKLNKDVRNLKFSNKWISGFLRRLKFKKRRITSVQKVLPSVEIVQNQMNLIKEFIVTEDISPTRVFNADETGVNWAPEIQYQYVPQDAVRATAPPGNESGRFTALIGSNAVGDMLPFFFIVKCSCKSPYDLSASTILNKFLGPDKLCKPIEGWTSGIWTKDLMIKGESKRIVDLITVQGKAWNDTAGFLMWIELQLRAYKVPLLFMIDPSLYLGKISSG